MNIEHALRKVAAPELNAVYTVPLRPGIDCGWFCREHTLHTKVLCALLGVTADIRFGDFSVIVPPGNITSGHEGNGHVWCGLDGVLPVDLSMTFAKTNLGHFPQLTAPVWGLGQNGHFLLSYRRRSESIPPQSSPCQVVFTEHKIVEFSARDLTHDPYLLLHTPDPTEPKNWDALFGRDIYAKITWHCFLLATNKVAPLRQRLTAPQLVRRISTNYSTAKAAILSRLDEIADGEH